MKYAPGFSLTELLVALLVLGQIATFTIPKVLSAQQNARYKALGKEAAGMISEALMAYRVKNTQSSGTRTIHLTPYMNYVALDNVTNLGANSYNCANASRECLVLHNGGYLIYPPGTSFGGTTTTNALWFSLDPDGTGPEAYLAFFLYYNGKVRTYETIETGTCTSATCPFTAQADPAWFSWD